MAKKRSRGLLSHSSTRAAVFYTPLVAGALVLGVFSGVRQLDPIYALAALGAEAQVFAMFASLTPIFFVFAQFYGRGRRLLRDLTITVVAIIGLSIFGIGLCIVSIVIQFFDVFVILLLFLLVVQIALLMALFLLSFAGFKRVQHWVEGV